jgi:hypothetical protein
VLRENLVSIEPQRLYSACLHFAASCPIGPELDDMIIVIVRLESGRRYRSLWEKLRENRNAESMWFSNLVSSFISGHYQLKFRFQYSTANVSGVET